MHHGGVDFHQLHRVAAKVHWNLAKVNLAVQLHAGLSVSSTLIRCMLVAVCCTLADSYPSYDYDFSGSLDVSRMELPGFDCPARL